MNKNTKKLFKKCVLACTFVCLMPGLSLAQEANPSKTDTLAQQNSDAVTCFSEYGNKVCELFAQLEKINKDFLDKNNTQSLQEFCDLFDACTIEFKTVVDEMEIALQQYKNHNLYPIFNTFVQELKARHLEAIKVTNILRGFIGSKSSILSQLLKMRKALNKAIYGTTSKRIIDQKKAESKAQFKQLCSEIQTFDAELAHELTTIVDDIEKTATAFKKQSIGHTKKWGRNRLS